MLYFHILIFVHCALCLTLIGLVLLQQGKGADMGAAFGGGSNTILGTGGAADFITRLTTGLAVAFMVTSILLVRAYTSGAATQGPAAPVNPLADSVMKDEPADAPPAPPAADNAASAGNAVPAENAK